MFVRSLLFAFWFLVMFLNRFLHFSVVSLFFFIECRCSSLFCQFLIFHYCHPFFISEASNLYIYIILITLAPHLLLANLRRSRRGAAPGPSGHTAEIVRLLLDDPAAAESLHAVAARLACAQLPLCASQALGLGRLIAVRKPSGSVGGIVVGDFLRRLVAWTLAQQFGSAFDLATKPHQHALTTRAGAEALAHTLQVQCDQDHTLTVLSVDGVGAFDLISRAAMLEALRHVPGASSILPFVRLFYGSASEFVWIDDAGIPHSILQAEGGEQGDPPHACIVCPWPCPGPACPPGRHLAG